MTQWGCYILASLTVLGATNLFADYYVAQNDQIPIAPYTNWTTAASNIQDAVNEVALYTSETIWIDSGRYTVPTNAEYAHDATNIVYALSRKISFRGFSGDPADTVIDGEGKYRAFAADYPHVAGQVFTFDALTLSNCVTTNYNGGSAIFFNTGNHSSTSTVQNCVITDNSALRGGGIHWQPKNANRPGLIISNSVFRNNQSSGYAGAVWTYNSFNLRLIDSVFENNQAERTTVMTRFANTLIDRCVFTGNRNDYGVVGLGECRAIVRNSLFSGNTAALENGVLNVGNYGRLDVHNCTIVSNEVGSHGAIRLQVAAAAGNFITGTVVNCIMYSNVVRNFSINNATRGFLYATNSCLSDTNGLPNFYADGNITNDPKFVNFAAGNFRLANGSSCIDAGTNLAWTADTIDLDGYPRRDKTFGQVDMGAYEYLYRGTAIMVQ